MFLGRDQMSQLTSIVSSWQQLSTFLEYQPFQHESVQQKGFNICQIFNKKQVTTISAILADVMEQSKIDIGKTIDTKLSENTTITPCDTTVWIKTIFMENMDDLLKQCTDTFCNMYLDCNVGNYKDKYALLQIRWGEWISSHLYVGQRKTMPWYQIQWEAEPIQQAMNLNLRMSVYTRYQFGL